MFVKKGRKHETIEENDNNEVVFVDVREEILSIKTQFDMLMSVIDRDFFKLEANPDNRETSVAATNKSHE